MEIILNKRKNSFINYLFWMKTLSVNEIQIIRAKIKTKKMEKLRKIYTLALNVFEMSSQLNWKQKLCLIVLKPILSLGTGCSKQ